MEAKPVVTQYAIYGFFEEYRFLSNFHPAPFFYDGFHWPTSEHAYMAEKTDNRYEKEHISKLPTASAARKYGRNELFISPTWNSVRSQAMLNVLFEKFRQNDHLKIMLLDTGNKYLEETNWWGDRYWGVCEGEGLNMLGKHLMHVRDSFRRPDGVGL